ncbi:MAG: hypothetical protein K6G34_04280 [Lachnospiraceae bacterium]|nr:hypothetical protein [Lachnospiraceae bacterium]
MIEAGKDRHRMRKNYKWCKILISAVLCPALVLGMAACGTNNGNAGNGTSAVGDAGGEQNEPAGEKAEEVVFRPPVDSPFVTPGEKDESVYVKADASGRPTEKTVEVVLKKIEGADPIEDRSNLREIKNTEGNEEYSEAGEGRYLWQNNGEDIHYKGKSDEELPVNVRITYYLEGQEVSAEQIAGKTGKVKIRFDYENSTNVPFMVLSAAMLPADVFSDVDVTNGRLMDLGDQKAVIGFAFPGLMDTLKLVDYEPTEEIELPEYVEIEARAEDFALDFTASVVSTGLFEDLEDKDLEDLDKLPEDMEELTDASTEIRDAAQELADGGSEFGDYLSQYFDGLSQLSEGTDSLDQGLTLLSQNISKISEGSKSLQEGLTQVDQSLAKVDLSSLSSPESREASEAAQAAFVSLGQSGAELKEKLGGIGTELETIRTFTEDVNTYIGQVQTLQNAVEESPAPDLAAADLENGWTESLNAEASGQAGEKAADVRDSIIEIVESSSFPDDLGLTDEQKTKIITQIVESINENTNVEDIEISLDAAFGEIRDGIQKDAEGNRNTLRDASAQIIEPAVPDLEALSPEKMEEIAQITANMEQSLAVIGAYAEGVSSLTGALTELSSAITQLKAGVSELSGGSAKLSEGLGVFEKALATASEGSAQLASAMKTVSSAGGELGSVYRQLVDGMNEFADGIAEFDEEGIQSLAELAGPEYKDVIRGIRAARDAEHSYTNFSGICDGQKGSVRFIIETEEINKDK